MNASPYFIAIAAGRHAGGRGCACVGCVSSDALRLRGGDWSQMDHVFATSKRPPGGPEG